MVDHQRNWHDRLIEARWSYRTSAHVSTMVMPFTLVCGIEVVLLLEVELFALRMITASQVSSDQTKYVASRIASLEAINEHRWATGEELKKYHKVMARKYNWDMKPRKFSPRMLVCNMSKDRTRLPISEFAPSWVGFMLWSKTLVNGAMSYQR